MPHHIRSSIDIKPLKSIKSYSSVFSCTFFQCQFFIPFSIFCSSRHIFYLSIFRQNCACTVIVRRIHGICLVGLFDIVKKCVTTIKLLNLTVSLKTAYFICIPLKVVFSNLGLNTCFTLTCFLSRGSDR